MRINSTLNIFYNSLNFSYGAYLNRRNQAVSGPFLVLKKTDRILHINDGTHTFCTLIKGDSHALLVDTGWGVNDLRKFIESLISTPYTVVNTHCHPDHCFGNFQFDEVLIPEKDLDIYRETGKWASSRDEFLPADSPETDFTKLKYPEIKTISAGKIFDLGGITVETVPLYSHTHGSLGYLIREEKLLLAGDAVSTGVWLFMKESLPLGECLKTYKNLLSLPFDKILGSHAKVFWSKDLIQAIIKNIENIMSPEYKANPETFKNIMDYEIMQDYAEYGDSGGWILVKRN